MQQTSAVISFRNKASKMEFNTFKEVLQEAQQNYFDNLFD